MFNLLIQLFLFSLFTFIAFFIPGNIFVQRLKLDFIQKTTLSYIFGISLWALLGLFFGFLNIREATYFYLITCSFIWIIINRKRLKPKVYIMNINPNPKDLIIIGILIIGISLQLLSVIWNFIYIKSGILFTTGVPDNWFHTALSKELITNFPPFEPGLYDIPLSNYHFLSNLITADLIRIFKLDLILVEYQLLPILFTLLFGLSIYSFAKVLKINKNFIIFILLSSYIIGDLIPYFGLLTTGHLIFNQSTLDNPMSLWVSISRYSGIVLYFGGLIAFIYYLRTKDKISAFIFSVIFGSIIGFKVYIGVLALIGLASLGILYLKRKEYKNTIPLIISFLISVMIYLPINKGAGGLIFTGTWRFSDFIAQPVWNLGKYEIARQIYKEHNNIIKLYLYNSIYGIVYIFFSVGYLLLGFLNTRNTLKKIPLELHLFLLSGLVFTSILGLFFIQTTGGANSSQFLISIYLVGSIYTALALTRFEKNKITISILMLALLFSSIRIIHTGYILINKITNQSSATIIDNHYLDIVNFSKNKLSTDAVIVFDKNIGNKCLLINILDTKDVFFCDSGAPIDRNKKLVLQKKETVNQIFNSKKSFQMSKIDQSLKSQTYIIATKSADLKFLKTIYSNPSYKILKIN